MEVVASLSQGRTAAAQCGLFTHKSVPVIFEPPCNCKKKCEVFLNLEHYLGKSSSKTLQTFITKSGPKGVWLV